MSGIGWFDIPAAALVVPLLIACLDLAAAVRATRVPELRTSLPHDPPFEILVPIYGNIAYLENVQYLAAYSRQVRLCTTAGETPEFYQALTEIARANQFQIFTGSPNPRGSLGKRDTGGTTRDRLVKEALAEVDAPYVVCIDADTVTEQPLGELVRGLAEHEFDLVSIRLIPSNPRGWLSELQRHEYRLAMSLRRIAPWLVSGACHAARTPVLREVMNRHSLFFQGNDVETGMIANALGYRVGHLPFPVPTAVPDSVGSWWRQRIAWSGGEFRLFIVNVRMARRHPLLWFYGALVVIAGSPFRWDSAITSPRLLIAVFAVYVVLLSYVNWAHRNRWLIVLPFYTAFSSLVMTPLGMLSYLYMAGRSRNAGIILSRRRRPAVDAAA